MNLTAIGIKPGAVLTLSRDERVISGPVPSVSVLNTLTDGISRWVLGRCCSF
jgi:hypothetical protein